MVLTLFGASFPLAVFAETGFARESLFLSKSSVIEGETVLLYTSVKNDTASAFSGKVIFSDAAAIGSVQVVLDAGEARVVSVSWKPSAGSHTVSAQLEDAKGGVVEKESATFTIAQKPKPVATNETSNQSAAAVDSSAGVQQQIANLSPTVAQTVAPAFAVVDSVRASAASALDKGIDWSKQQIAGGQVLGAQTQKSPAQSGWQGTLWTILGTLALYILSVLRYVVGSAVLFYPVLLILILFLLWRLIKRFRRPAWER